MSIEKKVNEIKDYFVNRLIDGDFTFIKCDDHKAEIFIDDYKFFIWISSGRDYTNFYYYEDSSLFPKLKNIAQKRKVWSHINKHVNAYKESVLIKQKRKQLEELKKELGEI